MGLHDGRIGELNLRIGTLVKCNHKGKFKVMNRQSETMENENTKTKMSTF
jgi:hypothetical protein